MQYNVVLVIQYSSTTIVQYIIILVTNNLKSPIWQQIVPRPTYGLVDAKKYFGVQTASGGEVENCRRQKKTWPFFRNYESFCSAKNLHGVFGGSKGFWGPRGRGNGKVQCPLFDHSPVFISKSLTVPSLLPVTRCSSWKVPVSTIAWWPKKLVIISSPSSEYKSTPLPSD